MRSSPALLLLASAIFATLTVNAQQPGDAQAVPAIAALPPAARAAAASIDPERIRAHVRFLSLDLLEGRGPGTRGCGACRRIHRHAVCARRPATGGRQRNLFPAGSAVTPCTPSRTRQSSLLCPSSGAPIDLAYGSEIVAKDQTGQPTADFDAPIVFVGYGIHAPEYNWNDYDGTST